MLDVACVCVMNHRNSVSLRSVSVAGKLLDPPSLRRGVVSKLGFTVERKSEYPLLQDWQDSRLEFTIYLASKAFPAGTCECPLDKELGLSLLEGSSFHFLFQLYYHIF